MLSYIKFGIIKNGYSNSNDSVLINNETGSLTFMVYLTNAHIRKAQVVGILDKLELFSNSFLTNISIMPMLNIIFLVVIIIFVSSTL